MVADVMGTQAPPELLGIHVTWPFTVPPDIDQAVQTGNALPSDLSADEQRACEQLAFFYGHDVGYAQEMSRRPQTIYAMDDSPVGLAAWLIDHDTRSYGLIARVFAGQAEGLTRDDLLDNITLYWLTRTAVSSARIYWENKATFFAPKNVAIPVAVSAFPDEVVQTPRSWTTAQPSGLTRSHSAAAELRGRVGLVNFWTLTFINWLRAEPYVRARSHAYRNDGLVVVGVHTPEFHRQYRDAGHACQRDLVQTPLPRLYGLRALLPALRLTDQQPT